MLKVSSTLSFKPYKSLLRWVFMIFIFQGKKLRINIVTAQRIHASDWCFWDFNMDPSGFEIYAFNHHFWVRDRERPRFPTHQALQRRHGLHLVTVASWGWLLSTHYIPASSLHTSMASSQCSGCSFTAEHTWVGLGHQINGERVSPDCLEMTFCAQMFRNLTVVKDRGDFWLLHFIDE